MVAAVEALQNCQQRKEIEITRVSGTSAGSIAAVLFAFGIRVNEIDSMMLKPAIDLVRNSDAVKDLSKQGWMANGSRLLQIYKGDSLVPDDLLRSFITLLFKGLGLSENTLLSDSKLPLYISAASLSKEEVFYFDSTDKGSDVCLIDAVFASCNIPLLFSSFNGIMDWRNAFVDGGLCENLPVEILTRDSDRYGKVLAISLTPDSSRWPPDNAKDFLIHLFNISVNNSVERAKRQVGAENVYNMKSPVRSMDFIDIDSSFRLEERYKEERRRAEEWMSIRFQALREAEGKARREIPSVLTSADILTQNWKSIHYRMKDKLFEVEYSALIAKPRCWGRGLSDGSDSPDSLIRAHRIHRQKNFELQEYPIGISAIKGEWTAPPLLRVEKICKNGNFEPVPYEISSFLKEGEIFGEKKTLYRSLITLSEALKRSDEEIGDDEADGIFIWYEQTTPCLFYEFADEAVRADSLGVQIASNTLGRVRSVYLAICGDADGVGATFAVDENSVPLEVVASLHYLPRELGYLCDHDKGFYGWRASNVESGRGARILLKKGEAHER